mmetsp:Transcript_2951/g.9155  ORF Transcript_2951/g.9155 Transcript_2951/m.9155 type:complete len:313 (-) Transcript_2951:1416-2354(-)
MAGAGEVRARGRILEGLEQHRRLGLLLELGDKAASLRRRTAEPHVGNAHALQCLPHEPLQFPPLDEDDGLGSRVLGADPLQGAAHCRQLGTKALHELATWLHGGVCRLRQACELATSEGRTARRTGRRGSGSGRHAEDTVSVEDMGAREHSCFLRRRRLQAHGAVGPLRWLLVRTGGLAQGPQRGAKEAEGPRCREELAGSCGTTTKLCCVRSPQCGELRLVAVANGAQDLAASGPARPLDVDRLHRRLSQAFQAGLVLAVHDRPPREEGLQLVVLNGPQVGLHGPQPSCSFCLRLRLLGVVEAVEAVGQDH